MGDALQNDTIFYRPANRDKQAKTAWVSVTPASEHWHPFISTYGEAGEVLKTPENTGFIEKSGVFGEGLESIMIPLL